jgi:hypothetical protein
MNHINQTEKSMKPVLVTTKHRGVFFGYLNGDADKETLTLTNARNCIYWSNNVKGFLGLAVTGPLGGCRVGPAVESLTLYDMTSVVYCTEGAVKAWESAPWS